VIPNEGLRTIKKRLAISRPVMISRPADLRSTCWRKHDDEVSKILPTDENYIHLHHSLPSD
jgi:hypothetical protein